jgi:hypothetical protein
LMSSIRFSFCSFVGPMLPRSYLCLTNWRFQSVSSVAVVSVSQCRNCSVCPLRAQRFRCRIRRSRIKLYSVDVLARSVAPHVCAP